MHTVEMLIDARALYIRLARVDSGLDKEFFWLGDR